METRLNVEVDADLKKKAQLKALQNDTTLKDIVTDALEKYLAADEKTEKKDIEIN